MSHLRQMLKESSVYTILNMARRSISFLMVPVYTRYLLPAEYGTLELLEITANIFEMLASAGLGYSVFKFYYKCTEEEGKKRIISTAVLGSMIFYGVFGLLGSLCSGWLSELIFGNPEYRLYFILIFVRFLVTGASTIITDYLRLTGRSIFYSVVILAQILTTVALNIYFLVYIKLGVLGMVLGTVVGQLVIGLTLAVWIFCKVGFHFKYETFRHMARYGGPMIFGSLGHFIINFGNRYFLQSLTTLTDVGVFSLGYRFGFIINFFVVSPFIMMWQGKMFEIAKLDRAKSTFESVFSYFFFLLILGATGLSLFSQTIVTLMADKAYHEATYIIPWIAFAFALNGCQHYFQLGMLLKSKTLYLGISTFALGVLSLVVYYLFISKWGMEGAAWATTAVYLLFSLVNYLLSQRFYPLRLEKKKLLGIILVSLAALSVSQLCKVEGQFLRFLVNLMLFLCIPVALFCTGLVPAAERHRLFRALFGRFKFES